ncbi:MAG: Trk system potassium transporter TrkA [Planctomycetaceae bacterium]|jgi:trk system potassium uptake protein TrkA|nr:Trk system potassium transporter TrkA [Planctomycetaceae bacterium]
MRILVLGGGKVGATIAEILCDHKHDVTVIEKDAETARKLDDALDVSVITGSATHADVLFQAAASAEICLAVTESDEVNLVAASLAKTLGVRRTAAHVYARSIRDTSTVDYQQHFGIDRLLSIESLTAAEFAREIRTTGDLMIEHFANGEVEMQEILIFDDPPPAMQKPLCELKFPPDVRAGVIRRGSEAIIAGAKDVIRRGDRLTLIGAADKIETVKQKFQAVSAKPKRVLIGGGGETGVQLARILQNRRHNVTIMDVDRTRCEYLANQLPNCTVIHGDATNRSMLQNEQIQKFDCFAACTGEDEENIISALEVKEYNAQLRTMVLINRQDYSILTEKLKIDKAIIPPKVIANQVLGFLNKGAVVFRNTQLFNRQVEVVELEVQEGAEVTKDALRNIKLPPGVLFGAVIHNGCVEVPGADFRFKSGDFAVALIMPGILGDLIRIF